MSSKLCSMNNRNLCKILMVINMDENIEFLQELYKTSEMGKSSLSELAKILDAKENKIKLEIDQDLEKYENIISKIDKLALKYDKKMDKTGFMGKAGSIMGIRMEVSKDNSDSKIADMLIQGYTMGILEVNRKLKKYKNSIGHAEKKIADELIDFQNKSIKNIKKYL